MPRSTTTSPSANKPSGKGIGIGAAMIGTGGNYRNPLSENNSGSKWVDVQTMTTFQIPATEDEGETKPDSFRGRKATRSRTNARKTQQRTEVNYNAKYMEMADKPGADGWSKISTRTL